MIIITQTGDNSPRCPKCGTENAMLYYSRPDAVRYYSDLQCRDCGHIALEGQYKIKECATMEARKHKMFTPLLIQMLEKMTIKQLCNETFNEACYGIRCDACPFYTMESKKELIEELKGD